MDDDNLEQGHHRCRYTIFQSLQHEQHWWVWGQHDLKLGEVAHNAAKTVAKETAQLNNTIADDNKDWFMGIDGEDFGVEMEEDETIIDDDKLN